MNYSNTFIRYKSPINNLYIQDKINLNHYKNDNKLNLNKRNIETNNMNYNINNNLWSNNTKLLIFNSNVSNEIIQSTKESCNNKITNINTGNSNNIYLPTSSSISYKRFSISRNKKPKIKIKNNVKLNKVNYTSLPINKKIPKIKNNTPYSMDKKHIICNTTKANYIQDNYFKENLNSLYKLENKDYNMFKLLGKLNLDKHLKTEIFHNISPKRKNNDVRNKSFTSSKAQSIKDKSSLRKKCKNNKILKKTVFSNIKKQKNIIKLFYKPKINFKLYDNIVSINNNLDFNIAANYINSDIQKKTKALAANCSSNNTSCMSNNFNETPTSKFIYYNSPHLKNKESLVLNNNNVYLKEIKDLVKDKDSFKYDRFKTIIKKCLKANNIEIKNYYKYEKIKTPSFKNKLSTSQAIIHINKNMQKIVNKNLNYFNKINSDKNIIKIDNEELKTKNSTDKCLYLNKNYINTASSKNITNDQELDINLNSHKKLENKINYKDIKGKDIYNLIGNKNDKNNFSFYNNDYFFKHKIIYFDNVHICNNIKYKNALN